MCSVLWIGTLSIVHWYGTSATVCTNITYTMKITAMAHVHYSCTKIIVATSNQSNAALIVTEVYNSALKFERYYITCFMRFGVLSHFLLRYTGLSSLNGFTVGSFKGSKTSSSRNTLESRSDS